MKTEKVREPRFEVAERVLASDGQATARRVTRKTKRPSGKGITIQLFPTIDPPEATDHACTCSPVTFAITAPTAKAVHVAGSFNDWDPHATALSKGVNGEWTTYMTLKPGQYQYRFIVDGDWKEDPAASDSVPNPYGERDSVLIVN